MKIILMYDLPTNDEKDLKEYRVFHKNIIKRGYIMLQYSLYYKTINAITKYSYEKKYLKKIVPHHGHVRSLIITEKQFYDMTILKGSKTLNENINNGERYLKIDETIWE